MKIELKIQDEEKLWTYAKGLIKFAKPRHESKTDVVYNIKDTNIPGLVWVICAKTRRKDNARKN